MPPPTAIRKVGLADTLHGRTHIIPFAMSDSTSSFASILLDELLAAMK